MTEIHCSDVLQPEEIVPNETKKQLINDEIHPQQEQEQEQEEEQEEEQQQEQEQQEEQEQQQEEQVVVAKASEAQEKDLLNNQNILKLPKSPLRFNKKNFLLKKRRSKLMFTPTPSYVLSNKENEIQKEQLPVENVNKSDLQPVNYSQLNYSQLNLETTMFEKSHQEIKSSSKQFHQLSSQLDHMLQILQDRIKSIKNISSVSIDDEMPSIDLIQLQLDRQIFYKKKKKKKA